LTDDEVCALARAAGIVVDWTDAADRPQKTAPAVLHRILDALGLPCLTAGDAADSRERLRREHALLPPLLIADAGQELSLRPEWTHGQASVELVTERGETHKLDLNEGDDGALVTTPLPDDFGYHRLVLGDVETGLAIAPKICFGIDDIASGARLWGLAAQLYGLRRRGDGGIGDFGGALALAQEAARFGADALALSPVHALFAAEPGRFGPYSPSSRIFLNPLYADPALVLGADRVARAWSGVGHDAERGRLERLPLIEWTEAATAKFAMLRALFAEFAMTASADYPSSPGADFARFCREGGDLLEAHARFEALHADQSRGGPSFWRDWQAEWRDPHSAAVAEFARTQDREIQFHLFLQWLAERSLTAAQAGTRQAGMRIGLVADLAIGTDKGGSHAWGRQSDILGALSIGAPPDILNTRGQDWGLAAFSPHALRNNGYAPFLATLRAAMRHAGGVRIDHVMGLARLWLVPEGASAAEGAYLAYPMENLLRLIALESRRHRAIVIGEDLGTVPPGFSDRLNAAGILSMRVLWFEREGAAFKAPEEWSEHAAAMTSTHDLPTVAGWWRGGDIAVRAALGLLGAESDGSEETVARRGDRSELWRSFAKARVARGPRPGPRSTNPVVDAAVRFAARSRSRLALIPLEDLLGQSEQPNLPGTLDEHPNWRRRQKASSARLLHAPKVAARLAAIREERGQR
jgi:4-alpha-glucanotransferase